jgi:predicted PurR-regulated permease PerM
LNRRKVKNVILILVAAGVGYLVLLMAQPFLIAISWAAVLAIVVEPVHKRVKRVIASRNVAAGLTCALGILVVLFPLVAIVVLVTRSVFGLIQQGGGVDPDSVSNFVTHEIEIVSSWLTLHFGFEPLGPDTISENAKALLEYLVGQTRSLLGGVTGFFFNLVVVIFSLFFFLRDKDAVLGAVRDVLPIGEKNANAVFERVHDVIWASVIGGGAVALTQGLLAWIGFTVLGIPLAPLWGVATATFSLIPFIGAAGVWLPTVVILLLKGSIWKAISLALWGFFVISLVDNVLRPILIGDRTKLHTLLIFFAILGGLQVFGLLGIILGPVVLAIALAMLEIFKREIRETEDAARSAASAGAVEAAPLPEVPIEP